MAENETVKWKLSYPSGSEDCELDSKKKTVKRNQQVEIKNETHKSPVAITIEAGVFADDGNLVTVGDFQEGSLEDGSTVFSIRSDPQKVMVRMWFGCADYSDPGTPTEIYVEPPGSG
jgi:hypothetical protein